MSAAAARLICPPGGPGIMDCGEVVRDAISGFSFPLTILTGRLSRLEYGSAHLLGHPIAIVLGTVSGSAWQGPTRTARRALGAGGALFLGPLLMIMSGRSTPVWFDWNLELSRFSSRVAVYLALMDDPVPSTDDHPVSPPDYPYPDAERDLNRWLPLVKWLAAIRTTWSCSSSPSPHFVVVAWRGSPSCAPVPTPRHVRLRRGSLPPEQPVTPMRSTLVTDEYPPFRLAR